MLSTVSARATTDTARVQTIYFSSSTSFGNAVMDTYAARGKSWLQTFRAIEKTPALRRALEAEIQNDAALDLIHRSLSRQQIAAQSSRIYVLKLARFSSQNATRNWLRQNWTPLVRADIYNTSGKSFRFGFGSEGIAKPQIVWEEKRGNGRTLYHGFYASPEDARRDARRLKALLKTRPTVVSRELSGRFVKNALFGPIGNLSIDENGAWR